jgi:hypothetical protein
MVVAVVTMIVKVMKTTETNKRKEKQNEVEYTVKVKTEGLRMKEGEEQPMSFSRITCHLGYDVVVSYLLPQRSLIEVYSLCLDGRLRSEMINVTLT